MASALFSAHYWSAVEAISSKDTRAVQNERLREQLTYLAVNSLLYRAKFAKHDVDVTKIRTVEDLAGLPFTENQELRDSLPRRRPPRTQRGVSSLVTVEAGDGDAAPANDWAGLPVVAIVGTRATNTAAISAGSANA
ncbi:phenylacetate-CoA ligase [Rhodococcus jostii]|uniref:Phenylacetate-CoA ligase n=1 Tax=Rhodococcus jostii TaxID=132919 RepID=A0A1H5EX45_RHOJO|nr:phenylacetate-CoA ligase [Rhodococcus jostii]